MERKFKIIASIQGAEKIQHISLKLFYCKTTSRASEPCFDKFMSVSRIKNMEKNQLNFK